ncbi:MAG: baseplate J/gp47 family protein [Pseudomonadota bacterium]
MTPTTPTNLIQQARQHLQPHTSWHGTHQSDPGITILEALAHNIAELSRRLALPVADQIAAERQHTRAEQLASDPITQQDQRASLLDLPDIRQAWLETTDQGTSRIYLDLHDTARNTPQQTAATVRDHYLSQRQINQDLDDIIILQKHHITVELHLAYRAIPNLHATLTDLIRRLQTVLSPTLASTDPARLHQQGIPSDQIYDGPVLTGSYYTRNALAAHTNPRWTYSSHLYTTLEDQDGLEQIHQISLTSGNTGDPWRLKTPAGHTPSLNIAATLAALRLDIDGQHYPLSTEHQARIREACNSTGITTPHTTNNTQSATPEHQQRRTLSHYRAIQHHFPEIYQLTEARLNKPTGQTDATIMQLKGYLTLFDQILADQYAQLDRLQTAYTLPYNWHLQQLGHHLTRMAAGATLTATDLNDLCTHLQQLPHTRRTQPLRDVPGQHHLLNTASFQEQAEPPFSQGQLERLDRSLTHLLARHAETGLDGNLLQNETILAPYTTQLTNYVATTQGKAHAAYIVRKGEDLTQKLVLLKTLHDKAQQLRDYPTLSRQRGAGYHYLRTEPQQPGLLRRLHASLGSNPEPDQTDPNRERIYLLESQLLRSHTPDPAWPRNQLYYIIPDWPTRYANHHYLTQLKVQIREHSPAHHQTHLIRLPRAQMALFEALYRAWQQAHTLRSLNWHPSDQAAPAPTAADQIIDTFAAHLRAFVCNPNQLMPRLLPSQHQLHQALKTRTDTPGTGNTGTGARPCALTPPATPDAPVTNAYLNQTTADLGTDHAYHHWHPIFRQIIAEYEHRAYEHHLRNAYPDSHYIHCYRPDQDADTLAVIIIPQQNRRIPHSQEQTRVARTLSALTRRPHQQPALQPIELTSQLTATVDWTQPGYTDENARTAINHRLNDYFTPWQHNPALRPHNTYDDQTIINHLQADPLLKRVDQLEHHLAQPIQAPHHLLVPATKHQIRLQREGINIWQIGHTFTITT